MIPQAAEAPRSAAATESPVCDLVLLTWNRRDLLEPCVERLYAHTTVPGHLIIVDNGSTDPATLAYLREVRGTPALDVRVVRLPENIGIAAALNAGLRETMAPWICLLNNDVLVTAGWLEEMIRVAKANPDIGLVNPSSNQFDCWPAPRETIDDVAARCQYRQGRWMENWQGFGFCLLMPRAVYDTLGEWSDSQGGLYFEDTDYSLRVRSTGRRIAIAEGAYVYHHGSATINGDPSRAEKFRASEAWLFRKWGLTRPERIAYVAPPELDTPVAAARVRQLANEGHQVFVFAVRTQVGTMPRHLLVEVTAVPAWARWPVAAVRILTKKKRFHRMVVPPGGRAGLFRGLAWLQGAAFEVEPAGGMDGPLP